MNSLCIFVDFAMPAEALELLREGTRGHELIFPQQPLTSALIPAEPDPQFARADIAFGQPDLRSIEAAGRLQWIHVTSAGITRYDTPEFRAFAASRRLAVSNSSSVYDEPCAVHALSFMLAQARNLPRALQSRASGGSEEWRMLRDGCSLLRGESVLIAGYGAIGRELIKLLRPFEMKITGFRRHPLGDETIPIIGLDEFSRAAAEADHLVNILPGSAETRHFFNAGRLAALKAGAVFYNIGRGATVDQEALLAALRSGRLKAAWLDVTDPEPLPADHPLRAQANCHITPHLAGGHAGEAQAMVRRFLENFARFVAGQPLVDRVM